MKVERACDRCLRSHVDPLLFAIRTLLLALISSTWQSDASAQAATSPRLEEILRLARFTIREIVVEGNALVSTGRLQQALAPFVGSGKSFDDIDAARNAVLAAYAQAGYELVSVEYEAARSRGGIHRLRVRELRIASVRVSGLESLSESSVRAQLPALLEDTTPALGRLARELSLFNDNPGRSATIEYSGAGEGRMNAEVSVTERSQSRFALSYNNTGTPQTGRSRLTFSGSHYDALGASHQASFSIGTSVEQPEKVMQLGATYAIPLPRFGDLLSFSASRARVKVGTVADVFNVAGESDTWNVRYVRNLVRTAEARHVLEVGYDERRYRDLVDFFGFNLGASVTAKPLSLGYRMQRSWSRNGVQFGLTWQQNLPGGARNDDAAYAGSRFGADANWSTVQLDAGWQRALSGDWVIAARLAGQYAGKPLISAEQFGLGGIAAVRGFSEREAAGDRGLRGSLEVVTPVFAGSHRLVGFLDAGRSRRLNALPGEVESEGVLSAGIGWRATLGKGFQLVVDAARVADGTPRFPDGSTKVHASAVLAF